MQIFRCLIIEDEPLAAELLFGYVQQIPFLQCEGICSDAIFALEKMHDKKIDLLFLDLHLPKIKGFDFLKSLQNPPQVIITTAYSQYAVEGFTLYVLDYLLKPIDFNRFLQAVNKLNKINSIPTIANQNKNEYEKTYLFTENKSQVRISASDILYIESTKEYIKIYTKNRVIITKFKMREIIDFLQDPNFIQVHRSFVISKNKVAAFNATFAEVEGNKIPIGRIFKETVLAQLKK